MSSPIQWSYNLLIIYIHFNNTCVHCFIMISYECFYFVKAYNDGVGKLWEDNLYWSYLHHFIDASTFILTKINEKSVLSAARWNISYCFVHVKQEQITPTSKTWTLQSYVIQITISEKLQKNSSSKNHRPENY